MDEAWTAPFDGFLHIRTRPVYDGAQAFEDGLCELRGLGDEDVNACFSSPITASPECRTVAGCRDTLRQQRVGGSCKHRCAKTEKIMRKRTLFVLAVAVALVVFWPKTATQPISSPPVAQSGAVTASHPSPDLTNTLPGLLPREARDMVAVIRHGGPFRHRQDGGVFGNREALLPRKQHGYYREYTVDTPLIDHRGTRRIVTGGDPPQVWYYTDDHYDSFHAFDVSALERGQ